MHDCSRAFTLGSGDSFRRAISSCVQFADSTELPGAVKCCSELPAMRVASHVCDDKGLMHNHTWSHQPLPDFYCCSDTKLLLHSLPCAATCSSYLITNHPSDLGKGDSLPLPQSTQPCLFLQACETCLLGVALTIWVRCTLHLKVRLAISTDLHAERGRLPWHVGNIRRDAIRS